MPVKSIDPEVTPFDRKLNRPLSKSEITILQINLGKICNLACSHCHVEAGPNRTEELSPEVCQQLIEVIEKFDQIQTVDLTGGAPEMHYGFRKLVEAARTKQKEVIVRTNLTIFFEQGYEDLPAYFAAHQVRVVASLPCYQSDNVDRMRGDGVFDASIRALQWLNQLGYGQNPHLKLDLVYNPPLPIDRKFSLTPEQNKLEQAYKTQLQDQFGISFNQLFTITNLPIGRSKFHLERLKLTELYLNFLESHFNLSTVEHLMCRNQLSIDDRGLIYDCDFNQMEHLPARSRDGKILTVADLLQAGSLDLIQSVQTAKYCYGCTAGSGSSCGGSLLG